jgi:hypothetical protein
VKIPRRVEIAHDDLRSQATLLDERDLLRKRRCGIGRILSRSRVIERAGQQHMLTIFTEAAPAEHFLREFADGVRRGRPGWVVFLERAVRRPVHERRPGDQHARSDTCVSEGVEDMMRAEYVGGKRVGDVVERLTDVRGACAVVHHARSQICNRAGHRVAIEQIDVLAPPPRHVSPGGLQVLDQVAPDEPAGAGHQDSAHDREPYCFW